MKRLQTDRDFISVRAAARALGVHENSVRNWMDEGILDHYALPGSGFRRVSVRAIEAVLNDREEAMAHDADLYALQDDVLVALTTKPPRFTDYERRSMRALPPWRAVMMARLAVSCGVMEAAELDSLVDEAVRAGGSGELAEHAEA